MLQRCRQAAGSVSAEVRIAETSVQIAESRNHSLRVGSAHSAELKTPVTSAQTAEQRNRNTETVLP